MRSVRKAYKRPMSETQQAALKAANAKAEWRAACRHCGAPWSGQMPVPKVCQACGKGARDGE